jgi:transposase InsO family protein
MRYKAAEKREIIGLVERSSLPVRRSLDRLGIPRSTFYGWYERYREGGDAALEDIRPNTGKVWNRLPAKIRRSILKLALERPELSSREVAVLFTEQQRYFVSESSVYRLLKAHDLITSPAFVLMKAADRFHNPTTAPNQLWQTDFTYLKVIGWGWFYLSTVLDDYSRYILAWKLCDGMTASDVSDTLTLALQASGLEVVNVRHRPRLLSDNGPSYVSAELRDWLDGQGMDHTRGRPYHPMTQGKIERWHRSMKNQVLLENYYLPGDLKARIKAFVEYYNTERYHESLNNLTPEDVYTGRGQTVLNRRRRIKQKTLAERRRLYYKQKAA